MKEFDTRQRARSSVLTKLGLSSLVSTSMVDIAEGHHAHVERQTIPARFLIEGLTIDAPAGVYHPTPESSSLFFIRNMNGMDASNFKKTLEIGAGCGAISLFMAARWKSAVTASDISLEAVESIEKNAELNGLKVNSIISDLFQKIEDKDFDFIVFNAPLIDKRPESAIEKYSLCDPDGLIIGSFLREAGSYIKDDGIILTSICSNSAYEVIDDVDLKFRIVGLELAYGGFWRALIRAQH